MPGIGAQGVAAIGSGAGLDISAGTRRHGALPAAKVLAADQREVIGIVVRGERLPPPGIPSWVVLLAHVAGWQPAMRRPLSGDEVLWRAHVQFRAIDRVTQAARVP